MIAPRSTNHNALQINQEEMVQAVIALLNQKQSSAILRWDCAVCGMIHMGPKPVECDSCGCSDLGQQVDTHREMNSHW
jgi:rubrerythrin